MVVVVVLEADPLPQMLWLCSNSRHWLDWLD
jgi:hypothetical protein